ncbi:MAG: hypothetical protein HHAS10_04820 [Candidatus Altimarinota bacterium]
MDFLIGFLIIGAGIAVMKYRYTVYGVTGEWGWASQYLGGNGTITAIVLIGMLLVGVGVAYPFGVFDNVGKQPTLQQANKAP